MKKFLLDTLYYLRHGYPLWVAIKLAKVTL